MMLGSSCAVVCRPRKRARCRLSRRDHYLREILEQTVAQAFTIPAPALWSQKRGRHSIALARQVAMYLAHVACGLNLTTVGSIFGRDRTTVAHACGVIEDRRDDPDFDRSLELLESVLRFLCPLQRAGSEAT